MRSRLSRLTSTGAIGAVLVLSACGGSSGGSNSDLPSDPQAKLAASVQNLAGSDQLTVTVKFDATADELQQFSASTGDPMPDDAANALSSGQIVITRDGGAKAGDVAIQEGGDTLIDIRSVDQTVYLQANVQAMLALAHQENQMGAIQQQLAAMPDFIQALVNGDWVSIDQNSLTALQNQLGAGTQASTPPGQAQIFAQVKTILDNDVTAKEVGTDSSGDHLQLTADTQKLAADLQTAFASAVPGGSALGSGLDNAKDVPNGTVTSDVWIQDGALSKFSINLAQFDTEDKLPADASLPLALTFAQSASDISAPSDATPVDLSKLGSLIGALTGSGGF